MGVKQRTATIILKMRMSDFTCLVTPKYIFEKILHFHSNWLIIIVPSYNYAVLYIIKSDIKKLARKTLEISAVFLFIKTQLTSSLGKLQIWI